MKQRLLSFILIFVLFSLSLTGLSTPQNTRAKVISSFQTAPEPENCREGTVLVTLASPSKTSLSKKGITKANPDIRVEKTWDFGDAKPLGKNSEETTFLEDKTLYISKVTSESYTTGELITELKKYAYVVSVEPDYYQKKMTADTLSAYQWYLDGGGVYQTSSEGIHYSRSQKYSGEKSPIVAIMDSGIDYTHEDLAAHMWTNPYPSLPGVHGYDFGDNDPDPMDEDEDGHGTHCAGSISAISDNEAGIRGIADSARLMALKIFDKEGAIANSYIVDALNYICQAQNLGADIAVVNCSWGGGRSNSAMNALIQKIGAQGALFSFSSGNEGINQDLEESPLCPFDLDSKYIIVTGASDMQDNPAPFSNYGQTVDLLAPGTQIVSACNTPVFSPAFYNEENRKNLCSFYSNCSDRNFTLYTPADLGLSTTGTTYLGITHTQADAFNNPEDGALFCKFQPSYSPAPESLNFCLYLDVTNLGLDRNAVYYAAYDVGADTVPWEHYTKKISKKDWVTSKRKTYLRIVTLSIPPDVTSSLNIDNVAVSTANPATDKFGKYISLTGTSMAAPFTTGAIANLACAYPDDTSQQRKQRLLYCTRPRAALASYCATGGILDLEKIATAPTPIIAPEPAKIPELNKKTEETAVVNTPLPSVKTLVKKIKLNKTNATLHYQKKLKLKASVTPKKANNKTVKWSSSKKSYASVTQKGVVKAKKKGIGHTVKIYAKATDGSGKKAYCKVKIVK